jgi:hypothetical protein
MLGNSWVAVQLAASQEGLSSMKLVMLVLLMGEIYEVYAVEVGSGAMIYKVS